MNIDITKDELDFILSCISCNKEMGLASVMHFDTLEYDRIYQKLYECGRGFETHSVPFIVEFTYDNGAIVDNMKSVCLAFDEDDACQIVKSNYSKTSDDFVNIKSVRKLTDNDIVSEKN